MLAQAAIMSSMLMNKTHDDISNDSNDDDDVHDGPLLPYYDQQTISNSQVQ
jgi:hypothetical protein